MRSPGFKRVFGWLRGDTARQVDAELQSHIDMKARDLMSEGADAAAAGKQARERFGDIDEIRGQCERLQTELQGKRGWSDFFDTTLQDVRFAVRGLRRHAGFSAVAILTLALGIGANTALFGVVNGFLLRTLPRIEQPERLVEIMQGDGDDFVSVSYPVFDHVRRSSRTLADIAAFDVVSMAMGGGQDPEVYFGLQVSGNYFDVLGVRPAAGRFFAPDQSFFPDVEDAVVISHSLWQRRFAGDEAVIGRDVVLNGFPATVIGVAPPGFGGHMVAVKADLFVPMGMQAPMMHGLQSLSGNRNGVVETIGRMADTVDIGAVREEVAALAAGFIETEEGADATYLLQTTPYGAVPGMARTGATLFFSLLMGIVGLLLLITCVNVANMLIARAGSRRREIAVRLSLGARRGRLVRQMLTESLLLSLAAAVCGTVMAMWLTGLLMSVELPVVPIPGMRLEFDFGLDARVLAFTSLLVGLTTVAFGLVPALRATRPQLVGALKDAPGAGSPRRSRLQGILVVAQTATTVLLLLGSGLFLRALQSAHTVDTGFRADNVYVAGFDLELNGYDAERTQQFYDELLRSAVALPRVEAVSIAGKLPLAGASSGTITVPGVEVAPDYEIDGVRGFSLHNQSVSAGYFDTLGLALVRGRTFTAADSADAPMVAVVNEHMAQRLWSIDTALGQRFELFGNDVEVVGVVGDAKYHGLVEDTPIFAYFSFRQRPRTDMYLHLRTEPGADAALLWPSLRAVGARLDATVPLLNTAPLSDALQLHFLPQLFAAWITGVAGVFGLLLGAIGIYGVAAHAASRRTHEIGVRIALGAGAAEVRRLILRQGLVAPLGGIVIGLLGAAALTRLLGSFLVGVSPLDPLTFAVVVGVLTAVAAGAALLPAHRAARVDPVTTLKAD